ncbi:ShlB/FhaC/HecB family hemolysin secretion/activation protein [filamentous cyanobacterium CCP5]|nr:ShlB/FhaC/HecB family hemolysin secretion/activation protein [filamentous cyanobacterium CCP5]
MSPTKQYGTVLFSLGMAAFWGSDLIGSTALAQAAENLENSLVPSPRPLLQAQNRPSQPGRDRFPQPVPPPEIPEPIPVIPLPSEPSAEPLPAPIDGGTDMTIAIAKIDVIGSSILGPEIQTITSRLEGQRVSLNQLQTAVSEITELYLDRGYLTSRAELRPQNVENGVVEIHVLEGGIESIVVEGTETLNPDYIRSRVALGTRSPLNVNDLENQLRLLLSDPMLANVRPTLKPGSGNQSILTVEVEEAELSQILFSFDNYSPPLVGSERLGISGQFLNPTGLGDALFASYYRTTTGGSRVFNAGYRVPLNPMHGTLQIEAQGTRDTITQPPFDALNISGSSQQYAVSYRQPIARSLETELALSLGFTYRSGETFIFDQPLPSGDNRTSVFTFGQDYLSRDPQGAWSLRSQFSFGTGLFNATQNSGGAPDGQFFSWLGQAQRLQVLDENQLLIARFDLQLSPDGLLPSERFVIGGGQSVRGYRQNARSGDNGFRLSVEDRITLIENRPGAQRLVVAPFVDMGSVWNASGNSSSTPGQPFLIGAGFGALWEPFENFNLRVDYGYPISQLSDRGNNIQDDGLYFSLDYRFEF